MAQTANYVGTPNVGIGQATVANTNRDGTGTLATIFTAGASGGRIDKLDCQAVATTTAGMLRFFMFDGTNSRLFYELPVAAVTPSGTAPAWRATLSEDAIAQELFPIVLEANEQLRVSTNNAETFNILATGGNF
jgi:hypothetical protein